MGAGGCGVGAGGGVAGVWFLEGGTGGGVIGVTGGGMFLVWLVHLPSLILMMEGPHSTVAVLITPAVFQNSE